MALEKLSEDASQGESSHGIERDRFSEFSLGDKCFNLRVVPEDKAKVSYVDQDGVVLKINNSVVVSVTINTVGDLVGVDYSGNSFLLQFDYQNETYTFTQSRAAGVGRYVDVRGHAFTTPHKDSVLSVFRTAKGSLGAHTDTSAIPRVICSDGTEHSSLSFKGMDQLTSVRFVVPGIATKIREVLVG